MVPPHRYSPTISLPLKHTFTQVSNSIINVGSSAVYNVNFLLWPYMPSFIAQLGGSHETATSLKFSKR